MNSRQKQQPGTHAAQQVEGRQIRARTSYTVMCAINCRVAAHRCSAVLVLCAILITVCGLCLVAEPPKHAAEDME